MSLRRPWRLNAVFKDSYRASCQDARVQKQVVRRLSALQTAVPRPSEDCGKVLSLCLRRPVTASSRPHHEAYGRLGTSTESPAAEDVIENVVDRSVPAYFFSSVVSSLILASFFGGLSPKIVVPILTSSLPCAIAPSKSELMPILNSSSFASIPSSLAT